MLKHLPSPKTYFILYFKTLYSILLNPEKHLDPSLKEKWLTKYLLFFSTNIILLSIQRVLLELIIFRKINLLFLGALETILLIFLTNLLLFITCWILYFIAQFLGGRANFILTFKTIVYATTPLIFIYLPIIKVFIITLVIYRLIFLFSKIQRYGIIKATINIVIPCLIIIIILLSFGMLSFLFMEKVSLLKK